MEELQKHIARVQEALDCFEWGADTHIRDTAWERETKNSWNVIQELLRGYDENG